MPHLRWPWLTLLVGVAYVLFEALITVVVIASFKR